MGSVKSTFNVLSPSSTYRKPPDEAIKFTIGAIVGEHLQGLGQTLYVKVNLF